MRAERSRVSYADLERMPDDGRRFEIIDGELIEMTPSPSPLHQRVAKRLVLQLVAWFENRGRGEVFFAPLDVILNPYDVFQPDIIVVTNAGQISRRAIEGAPTIVVEVLSPTSVKYDRVKKGNRYAVLGLPHYWILDPDARRLECYRLAAGAYALAADAIGDASLQHPDFPGLTINLAPIWA